MKSLRQRVAPFLEASSSPAFLITNLYFIIVTLMIILLTCSTQPGESNTLTLGNSIQTIMGTTTKQHQFASSSSPSSSPVRTTIFNQQSKNNNLANPMKYGLMPLSITRQSSSSGLHSQGAALGARNSIGGSSFKSLVKSLVVTGIGSIVQGKKSFSTIKDSFGLTTTIGPTGCYNDLVDRLQKWHQRYSILFQMSTATMKSPEQVIEDELSNLDTNLVDEECNPYNNHENDDDDDNKQGGSSKQNNKLIDYVYKMLKKLVKGVEKALRSSLDDNNAQKSQEEEEEQQQQQLDENKLDQLIETNQIEKDEEEKEKELKQQDLERTLERAKTIAIKTASEILEKEWQIVSESIVYSSLPEIVGKNMRIADTFSFLKPIFKLISQSSSTPLALRYLLDMELRAAISVINRANPSIAFLKCTPKDKDLTC